MAARGPAENAELVLQADDVDIADVEEIRGAQIGGQVLLLNLEANHFRIFVAALNVIDRHREALALGMRACDGGKQVGGEGGDAALARQVVADKGDLADFRGLSSFNSFGPNDKPVGGGANEVERIAGDQGKDFTPIRIKDSDIGRHHYLG